jgi:uncharacterized membrane protein YedE/YeeE
MEYKNDSFRHVYWNPYFGGLLLGLLIAATFYVTGRGVGATGGTKATVVTAVNTVAPEHAGNQEFYSKYVDEDKNPMENWLVFETLGIIIGAFLSGSIKGRVNFRVQHSPKITSRTRLIFALAGGLLFGVGSQFARGCTSGAALSGSTVLSLAGFITMIGIFGTAYVFAYFFRKLWI